MSNFEHVLSPFKFGNVVVKNRIELAPACYMLTTPDGFVTREMIAFYQNPARGGAGIITIVILQNITLSVLPILRWNKLRRSKPEIILGRKQVILFSNNLVGTSILDRRAMMSRTE